MQRDDLDDFFDSDGPTAAEKHAMDIERRAQNIETAAEECARAMGEVERAAMQTVEELRDLHVNGLGQTQRWTREAAGQLEQIKWILVGLFFLLVWRLH